MSNAHPPVSTPDVQTLVDQLLPRRTRHGVTAMPPEELAARVQVIAAISTNQPALIDAGLRNIDPAFVDPVMWGKWAIWANARVTLDVLSERWGLTPFDPIEQTPLFAWAFQAAATPAMRDWCEEHGVRWTQRWDGPRVVDPSFPKGPITLLSTLLWDHAWAVALDGLNRPDVQQDQDQLDRGLFTLMARVASGAQREQSLLDGEGLSVLQRLLDLGANPARVFEQRSPQDSSAEPPTAAHWAVAALLNEAERPPNGPMVDLTAQDQANASELCAGAFWARFADRVDWATLPVRSPLIDAFALRHIGLKNAVAAARHDPDQDLAWHGQWLVQDLLHRNAALVGPSSDVPLVRAWTLGTTLDRWDPFWTLCEHHRRSGSPERLPLSTTIDLVQQWAALWGDKLTADWHRQDSSVLQARVMEQTARLRALLQWAEDAEQPRLETFAQQARHEMRDLLRSCNTPQEQEAQRDQARLLADTWTLRAETCRLPPASVPEPRRRL